MFEVVAEDLVQSWWVAGVLVSGDLVRRRSGDRHGRAEECLGGFLIAGFAQVDVDQVAVAVDRPVQVLPLTRNFDVRFIDIPAAVSLAFSPSAQGSVSSGASLASQSRIASWLNTKPRSSRISARSRRLSFIRNRHSTIKKTTSVGS